MGNMRNMKDNQGVKKRGGLSFLAVMSMVGLIPLLVLGIALCSVAVNRMSGSLKTSIEDRLQVVAEGLGKYYEWDIANKGEIAYEHDYVDLYKEEGIEQTVFMGDTRFITSIKDSETGKRNEGTKADPEIYKIVSSGKDYHADNVDIAGKKYLVYYMPLKDSSGKVVGMSFAGEPEAKVNAEVQGAVTFLVVVTVVLCLICAAIVILVAIRIKKPIGAIVESTDTLSQGILDEKITAKSPIREIEILIESAQKLQKNLVEIISKVNSNVGDMDNNMNTVAFGVDTCNQASEGIVTAVDELSRGTMDMAESIQQCTVSMQDIGEGITGISSLAESANENADEVTNVSNSAKSELQTLLEANGNTIRVSGNVVSGIGEANDAAVKIRSVAEMITEIATETSLLALNASIEAARAGEAGAGFAVVANSIQSLANQSQESAEEIQKVVENIIAISEKNVNLAQDIQNAVDGEGKVLNNVNKSFDTVNTMVIQTADAINSILEKATDLERAKVTVLDEISNLSAVSEENAASCQETNASMEELRANIETINQQAGDTRDISGELTNVVSYFKMETKN